MDMERNKELLYKQKSIAERSEQNQIAVPWGTMSTECPGKKKRQSMESNGAETLRIVGTKEMPSNLTIWGLKVATQKRG